MSQSPTKPLPFTSPRASPFRRPESPLAKSPSPSSPTKLSNASSIRASSPSLSPEKHNPFVRRPSQLGPASERPSSPFARPSSRLSHVESPSRALSFSRERTPDAPTPALAMSPAPALTPAPALDPTPAAPSAPSSPSPSQAKTPTLGAPILLDGTPSSPPSFSMSPSPSYQPEFSATTRPVAHRTITSSTAATVRPFSLNPPASSPKPVSPSFKPSLAASGGNYAHMAQPLLRSMRESYEVLDSANSGTINSANLADLLEQLGLDSSPRALSEYFPPSTPSNLNLARYLDILSASHAQLSQPEELAAAFGAFDVDDSGQVDLGELRDALLHTAPEPGASHTRMSEREIDTIMNDFVGRRAFGGKGLFGKDFVGGAGAKGRGDVFKYRDFMASVTGGTADSPMDNLDVA